jgi:hypothetical protein
MDDRPSVQMQFPELRKRYWGGISEGEGTSAQRAVTSPTM